MSWTGATRSSPPSPPPPTTGSGRATPRTSSPTATTQSWTCSGTARRSSSAGPASTWSSRTTPATRPDNGWSNLELTWRHRDGSPVRLQGSAVPIRDRRGHVTGYRGTRRLVSDDLHPREAVKTARERIGGVLEDRAVDIALQPIVALSSGRITGVEALARFHDGRSPAAWFHDAHVAGRTRDLDELTFTAALAAFPALPPDVYLSVNASPELLMDAAFRDRVTRTGPAPGSSGHRDHRARPRRGLRPAQRRPCRPA